MDLETSNAIESLRKEVVSAATSLRRQISATEYALRAEMRDEVTGTLRAEMRICVKSFCVTPPF